MIGARTREKSTAYPKTTVPIEWVRMRVRFVLLVSFCILLLLFVVWHLRSKRLASLTGSVHECGIHAGGRDSFCHS